MFFKARESRLKFYANILETLSLLSLLNPFKIIKHSFLNFRMLFAFIKQQQQDNAVSLCIIYTVGGLIKDNSGNLVC